MKVKKVRGPLFREEIFAPIPMGEPRMQCRLTGCRIGDQKNNLRSDPMECDFVRSDMSGYGDVPEETRKACRTEERDWPLSGSIISSGGVPTVFHSTKGHARSLSYSAFQIYNTGLNKRALSSKPVPPPMGVNMSRSWPFPNLSFKPICNADKASPNIVGK